MSENKKKRLQFSEFLTNYNYDNYNKSIFFSILTFPFVFHDV